jgi:hypothetical protein
MLAQLSTMVLSSVVRQLEHQADDHAPSSAEVRMLWSYTSTPLHDVVLIKHRDIFTFTIILMHES